jgi:hypothetical protein
MKKFLTSALAASVATVALATVLATSPALALNFTSLTLINGWKTFSPDVRAPKVAVDAEGVVHFMGAIKSGTDDIAFTLAAQFRPAKITYVVVDLCNAAEGRLNINPDGNVYVTAGTAFGDAQCFTSLEGAQFAK